MSQVYQSRSVIRENRIEDSALQVREAQRLAQTVASKEESKTDRTASAVPQGDQGGKRRRGREGNRVDPNLNHEAVKLYRDIFKFCPNRGTRNDIAVTVTDLDLWKDVLRNWGYWKDEKWIKFNPLNARRMLSEYERRAAKLPNRSANKSERTDQRASETEAVSPRVSEWRSSNLSCVQEDSGVRFRASSKTLEEIVTEALRTHDRSEAEVK